MKRDINNARNRSAATDARGAATTRAAGQPHATLGAGQSVWYLTYDGLLDPLGRSQVLPYVRKLARLGHRMTVVSWEKPHRLADGRAESLARSLADAGIQWQRFVYHQRPTFWSVVGDLGVGWWHLSRSARQERPDLLHARSYVAGVLAQRLSRKWGVPWLFDMRGFWPEEKVDGRQWRAGGWLYRCAKRYERQFLQHADGVVVLTNRARDLLRSDAYSVPEQSTITVIPTCADTTVFTSDGEGWPTAMQEAFGDAPVFTYLGSIGTWYLFQDVVRWWKHALARWPEARFLVLANQDPIEYRSIAAAESFPQHLLHVEQVPHREVPRYLRASTALVTFIRPCFSKQGSCATKLAEALACGVPLVVNARVGDHNDLFSDERAGVLLQDVSDETMWASVRRLDDLLQDRDMLRQRCRALALKRFSLERGVADYHQIYASLGGSSVTRTALA